MRAYLIDSKVLERALENIRSAITETELLEHDYDWFVSDSVEGLRNSYEELEVETMRKMDELDE